MFSFSNDPAIRRVDLLVLCISRIRSIGSRNGNKLSRRNTLLFSKTSSDDNDNDMTLEDNCNCNRSSADEQFVSAKSIHLCGVGYRFYSLIVLIEECLKFAVILLVELILSILYINIG